MNSQLETMLTEAEGRYLSTGEEAKLTVYMDSLPRRMAAMRAVEAAEGELISRTLNDLYGAHPDYKDRYQSFSKKAERDITLVLRYCTLAMVRDDETMLAERLLYWLNTIFTAFNFGAALDTAYRALARHTEAVLPAEHVELLAPYLRLAHQIITQPARGNS